MVFRMDSGIDSGTIFSVQGFEISSVEFNQEKTNLEVPKFNFKTPKNVGRFVGNVDARWLDNNAREMMLLSDFTYIDPTGFHWVAQKGTIINGASIPSIFWPIVGSPFNGRYRFASVIHDAYCLYQTQTSNQTHYAFYLMMLAEGFSPSRARAFYNAVYWFCPLKW